MKAMRVFTEKDQLAKDDYPDGLRLPRIEKQLPHLGSTERLFKGSDRRIFASLIRSAEVLPSRTIDSTLLALIRSFVWLLALWAEDLFQDPKKQGCEYDAAFEHELGEYGAFDGYRGFYNQGSV